MSNIRESLTENKLFEQVVGQFLESDDYYSGMATNLKTALQVKEEHRQQLVEKFKFKDFGEKVKMGFEMVYQRLPTRLSLPDWQRIVSELDHMRAANREAYVFAKIPKLESQDVHLQALFEISDISMETIYSLGSSLIDEGAFIQAEAVFTILSFMNPNVPEYMLGTACALYWQEKYEEALMCLDYAKILKPQEPVAFIYSALCKTKVQQLYSADSDLVILEFIFKHSDEQRLKWEKAYHLILNNVKQ